MSTVAVKVSVFKTFGATEVLKVCVSVCVIAPVISIVTGIEVTV